MAVRMSPQMLGLLTREADQLQRYLLGVHASLRLILITECRGPATVTMTGLGEIKSLKVNGVDEFTQDCLLAALRAAEGRAQAGYERFAVDHG
jgi:DNA-binding protein YbaB